MEYRVVKRLVFKHYNHAKKSGVFEKSRLNKALGIVLSKEFSNKMKEYGTTVRHCYCPDCEYRTYYCKHKIAFMINYRVWEDVQKLLEKEMSKNF